MANFNRCEIIGNVGSDPQTRQTQGGKSVTSFSVAVNQGSDQNKKTTWFKVQCWEKLSDIAMKFVKKGNAIFIAGPIEVNQWTTNNNEARADLQITARDLQLIGGGGGSPQQGGGQKRPTQYSKTRHPEPDYVQQGGGDDDIPF